MISSMDMFLLTALLKIFAKVCFRGKEPDVDTPFISFLIILMRFSESDRSIIEKP